MKDYRVQIQVENEKLETENEFLKELMQKFLANPKDEKLKKELIRHISKEVPF